MCRTDFYYVKYCCGCNKSSEIKYTPIAGCRGCLQWVGSLVKSILMEPYPCPDCQKDATWVPWKGMWFERSVAESEGWTGYTSFPEPTFQDDEN